MGLPAIVRPSFTLGGTGAGVAYNRDEYLATAEAGLAASPVGEALIEESVLGWKEFEMEVVRDRADNCIIVCSIENVDPMGVHTGDSITVAPALTLTDKEYQIMRDAAIAVLREVGVDTGGSNVQFAVDPASGRMLVIEMNPRVSRSSALASKATGFPIAKIAAKLAVGYTLDELDNDITGVTPASFEPTIDYVVTKVPRFTFEKFPGTEASLTTSMKSVGEAMAIGRTFAESLQKALRSMETGLSGLDEVTIPGLAGDAFERDAIRAALGRPSPDRILIIAQALRLRLHGRGGAGRDHLRSLVRRPDRGDCRRRGAGARPRPATGLGRPHGAEEARVLRCSPGRARRPRRGRGGGSPAGARPAPGLQAHRHLCRRVFQPHAVHVRRIRRRRHRYRRSARPSPATSARSSSSAAGRTASARASSSTIAAATRCSHSPRPDTSRSWSTATRRPCPLDYDTSDRLYFEPLTAEDVIEICRVEQSRGTLAGVIVQFGGQTPLKLAHALEAAGIPILGTTPDAIDLAEDRHRFQRLLTELGLRQPPNGIATSAREGDPRRRPDRLPGADPAVLRARRPGDGDRP